LQGANHDARIWENSNVKTVIERQRQYLVVGDSGYLIGEVLMKPYPNREALANPRKAEFNSRLSRIRTRYTENIFGIMKRKYSILKTLRAHYDCARRIIIAIAILHNISIRWRQEDIMIDGGPALLFPPSQGLRSSRMRRHLTWFASAARSCGTSCSMGWTTGEGARFSEMLQ
jgi:hypothetical protein